MVDRVREDISPEDPVDSVHLENRRVINAYLGNEELRELLDTSLTLDTGHPQVDLSHLKLDPELNDFTAQILSKFGALIQDSGLLSSHQEPARSSVLQKLVRSKPEPTTTYQMNVDRYWELMGKAEDSFRRSKNLDDRATVEALHLIKARVPVQESEKTSAVGLDNE